MLRLLPVMALIVVCACSRTPAEANAAAGSTEESSSAAAAPADAGQQAAVAAEPEPVEPVPTELPAVLARVNGEAIDRAEFEKAVQNVEARAGGPVPVEERDRILRGLLDQIIGYKLLVQETAARKIVVPDAEVDARLTEIRGQFPSEEVFKEALQQQQLTLDELRTDERQNIAISRMIEEEIADKVRVSDEQVLAFYKENPEQFQQDERVRASHILIAFPQDADAAAKAGARTTAEAVLKDVKAGKDFAELAKQHSQDPGSAQNGGDLGYFQQGEMVGPFNDVVFQLQTGTTSDLVETDFGFHIIKVADKQPARTIPLEEVRPRLEEFLQDRNREQQTETFVEALKARGKVEIFL